MAHAQRPVSDGGRGCSRGRAWRPLDAARQAARRVRQHAGRPVSGGWIYCLPLSLRWRRQHRACALCSRAQARLRAHIAIEVKLRRCFNLRCVHGAQRQRGPARRSPRGSRAREFPAVGNPLGTPERRLERLGAPGERLGARPGALGAPGEALGAPGRPWRRFPRVLRGPGLSCRLAGFGFRLSGSSFLLRR